MKVAARFGAVILFAAVGCSAPAASAQSSNPFDRVAHRLARHRAVSMLIVGDSTGSAATRWPHRFTEFLAHRYAVTVRYHLWDASSEAGYLPAETVRTGRGSLDVWNASMPGAGISYTADYHWAQQTVPTQVDVAFVNYSHNDSAIANYDSSFGSIASMLHAKYPGALIVGLTQNPETAPRSDADIAMQARHARQIRAVCRQRGYTLIDTYAMFAHAMQRDGDAAYVDSSDGEHPTTKGDELWAYTVEAAFTWHPWRW